MPVNQYDGICYRCRQVVPAGTGRITWKNDKGWRVKHWPPCYGPFLPGYNK